MQVLFRRAVFFGTAILFAAVAQAALPEDADAQRRHGGHVHDDRGYEDDRYGYYPPRVKLGGGLGVAVPQGEFGRFVGEGFAGNLHLVVGLERTSTVALRFDGGFVNYGSERFSVPVIPTSGRIFADIRTRNNIATFGVGPQLQLSSGRVRPYVNGFVGFGYFFTESALDDGFHEFGNTLNFDDFALGYGLGGGLALQLGRGSNLLLNLDAQYRRHQDVEYLREGSIVEDGFGGVFVDPIFSDADFLTFQIGLSVGL